MKSSPVSGKGYPTVGYAMTHPFTRNDDVSWYGSILSWFIWVHRAGMPLGVGAIGALQKGGYKRLAVAWAIGLTWLMHAHFEHSKQTSPSP